MKNYSVNYHFYYDLVFRAKFCYLEPGVYTIDFLDYVMAGIAFNSRSYELSSRKISFFAQVYEDLLEAKNTDIVHTAIQYFYEDIFDLYQKYLKSFKAEELKEENIVIIVPSWEKTSYLKEHYESGTIGPSAEDSLLNDLILNLSNYRAVINNKQQLKYIQFSYECTLQKNNKKLLEVKYE